MDSIPTLDQAVNFSDSVSIATKRTRRFLEKKTTEYLRGEKDYKDQKRDLLTELISKMLAAGITSGLIGNIFAFLIKSDISTILSFAVIGFSAAVSAELYFNEESHRHMERRLVAPRI